MPRLSENDIYHVILHIVLRVAPKVYQFFFRKTATALIDSKELSYKKAEEKKYEAKDIGDCPFIVASSFLSDNNTPPF